MTKHQTEPPGPGNYDPGPGGSPHVHPDDLIADTSDLDQYLAKAVQEVEDTAKDMKGWSPRQRDLWREGVDALMARQESVSLLDLFMLREAIASVAIEHPEWDDDKQPDADLPPDIERALGQTHSELGPDDD